jgi:hypothetical protein
MSRSMRSRSFSRSKRAISADGSAACVVGRRVAAVGFQPDPLAALPTAQQRIAQAKLLGHRSDRAPARRYEINRLPPLIRTGVYSLSLS